MKLKLLSAFFSVLLAGALCVAAFAQEVVPQQVRLGSSEIKLKVGATRQLIATVLPADADQTLRWRSSDTGVADVSDTGLVTGIGSGAATITVSTSNGRATACRVTVRKDGENVPAKKMEMAISKLTLRQGESRELWILFEPFDTTERDVEWSTSDKSVATVDNIGCVTGISPGTATITATAWSGAKASCTVTVSNGNFVMSSSQNGASASQSGTAKTDTESGIVSAATVRSAVQSAAEKVGQGETATATFQNKTRIAANVLSAAAKAAGNTGKTVCLEFTTTDSNGNIQGGITFDPQRMKRDTDLRTRVSTTSSKAKNALSRLEDSYQNRLAVIHCSQSGSFGAPVEVRAKTEFEPSDAENLRFYLYDIGTGRVESLAVSNARVSKGGSVRFTTETGGVLVVSAGELQSN